MSENERLTRELQDTINGQLEPLLSSNVLVQSDLSIGDNLQAQLQLMTQVLQCMILSRVTFSMRHMGISLLMAHLGETGITRTR